MTPDYPHITKSLDTITPISAISAHLVKCSLPARNCSSSERVRFACYALRTAARA